DKAGDAFHYWRPYHIIEAKRIKKDFSAEILKRKSAEALPFPGKEAHYLRAQIARISASTLVAPADYFFEPSGRCTVMTGEEEDEEEDEEEKNKKRRKRNWKRMTIGRLEPWNIKLSSKLPKVVYSYLAVELWPGAFTFYDGNAFDHIYIGFGYKYSAYHYGPVIPITFQKEYAADSDILEPEDEEEEEPEPEEPEGEEEGDEEGKRRG
ncbi:radial spoke head protein 6 A, partial [Caerostris extrusa]